MKTFLVLLVVYVSATAEWGPIVRLSETDSASTANGNSLVVQGNSVHAVWQEPSAGGSAVYHRASADNGQHWGSTERLGGCNDSYVYYRLVSGTSNVLHFAYDSAGLRYRRSTDNGASWSSSESLPVNTASDRWQISAGPNGLVVLVWYVWVSADTVVHVMRSTDDGQNWQPPERIAAGRYWTYYSTEVVLVSRDPFVHVACTFPFGDDTLRYWRSTDNGTSWLGPQALPRGELVEDEAGRLHLAWSDSRTGQEEVYYMRSTDNGASWSSITRLTWGGSSFDGMWVSSDLVCISYNGDSLRRSYDGGANWESPAVLWYNYDKLVCLGENRWMHELSDGGIYGPIEYRRSKDAGGSWEGIDTISDTTSVSRQPKVITLGGGDVHVLWTGYDYGNTDVFYRRGVGLAGLEERQQDRVLGPALTMSANPSLFRRSTAVSYTLTVDADVSASIQDIGGRLVWSAPIGMQKAGKHILRWNGKNAFDEPVSAGCYFCVLQAGGRTSSSKLLVTR